MFHFEGGPQSAREIEALTNELLGPEEAAKFWNAYLDRYITRDDIQFLQARGLQFDSRSDSLQILSRAMTRGFPPARSRGRVGARGRHCMS